MNVTQKTKVLLYRGDCIEGMRKNVPTASVDIIVTSPPYNLGIKYNSYADQKDWDDYLRWTVEWAREAARCLKPDGSLFLNVGGSLKAPLLPHVIMNLLVEETSLFVLQNTIHWIKSIALSDTKNGPERQRGHYKPINSDRFVNDCHEHVFHLTKSGVTKLDRKAIGVPYSDKSNIGRWGHTDGEDLKCRGNEWFIPYKTITRRTDDRPHPATFPDELVSKCVKLHGKNGSSVVMDPFLGIGHAAYASIDCGVAEFIGFEIDASYMSVVCDELAARAKIYEQRESASA
ncbi:MAG: modification methylase [Akkermansiaceae bacterium]|nr:modification methylase [Akkermansiaceae bacterium]